MSDPYVDPQALEKDYPSIDLAYAVAVASYDAMIKRLDAIDGRVQTLLAFAVSAVFAVPSIGSARGLSFASPWFIGAMILLAISVALATYARLGGVIRMLDPKPLYEGWLHLSQAEFKLYMIEHAAQDFDHNNKLLNRKWLYAVVLTCLFLVEAVFLAVWVAA